MNTMSNNSTGELLMSTPFPLLNVINSLLPSPICRVQGLKPDRPASSYIISQSDYQQSFLTEKASQSQKQTLLHQIAQLQSQLSKTTSLLQSNQSQYHQQLLLLKLQIQRVRTIMRQQGQTIQRQVTQFNQLQQVYKLKLQQVKHFLTKTFQDQMKQKQKQTLSTLQQVRQLYIDKISTLTKSYQKQLQQKELQIHQHNHQSLSMKISSIKQLQLTQQLAKINQQNHQLTEEVYTLRKQLQQQRQHRSNLIDQTDNNQYLLRLKYDQTLLANTRLHQQIASINSYITTLSSTHSQALNKLTQQLQSKNQQMGMLRWKCNKLQEQLDQFKNRKTQGLLMGMENHKKYGGGRGEVDCFEISHQTEHNNVNNNNNNNGMGNNHFSNNGNPIHANINSNNTHNNQNSIDRSDTQQRISYQQIRYETQSRISYQQSLKKMHEMQLKIEQLSQQLYKSNTQNQLLAQKINQLKDQLEDQLLHANQLKNYLTEKDQIIQNMVHTQQQQQQSNSNNKNSTLGSQTKQKDTLIIQKDQTISTLTKQIEQQSHLINKMQKQIQRLNKKQLNYQTQLMTIEQSYKSKLKNKQSQLKGKDNQISKLSAALNNDFKQIQKRDECLRTKEQQVQRLMSEIRRLQTNANQSTSLIKFKQQQILRLNEKLYNSTQEHKLKNNELNGIKTKYNQIQTLCRLKDKLILDKDQQINRLEQSIHRLENESNNKQQIKKIQHQAFVADGDNPFADPFIKQQYGYYQQQHQQSNKPKKQSPQSSLPTRVQQTSNTNTKQLQAKLVQYQQKIAQLQSIVQSLRFSWAATEQNENAIFSYIKSAYIDQIKALKTKNQQMENDMKYSSQFIQIMAKKQSSMQSQGAIFASKSKGKNKK